MNFSTSEIEKAPVSTNKQTNNPNNKKRRGGERTGYRKMSHRDQQDSDISQPT